MMIFLLLTLVGALLTELAASTFLGVENGCLGALVDGRVAVLADAGCLGALLGGAGAVLCAAQVVGGAGVDGAAMVLCEVEVSWMLVCFFSC